MFPFVIPRRRPTVYPGLWRDAARLALRGAEAAGPRVERFEEAFAAYLGARHAVAAPSGRAALGLILAALGLAPGDEVLMPAYTLDALGGVVASAGLDPVHVDAEARGFNLDLARAEKAAGPRARVLLATHLFGVPMDLDAARALCAARGLHLVEDCAHALGARFGGAAVGGFGAASYFSFATIKGINAFGGGMIVTNDAGLRDDLRARVAGLPASRGDLAKAAAVGFVEWAVGFRALYGLTAGLLFQSPALARAAQRLYRAVKKDVQGGARALGDLKAFLALRQMPGLEARIAHRAALGRRYEKLLAGRAALQAPPPGAERVYYQMIALAPRAALVRGRLFLRGVDAGCGREILQNLTEGRPNAADFPVARRLAREALELPLCDAMTLGDVHAVADALEASLVHSTV